MPRMRLSANAGFDLFLAGALFLFLFSSCSFQKRHYRKGFYVHFTDKSCKAMETADYKRKSERNVDKKPEAFNDFVQEISQQAMVYTTAGKEMMIPEQSRNYGKQSAEPSLKSESLQEPFVVSALEEEKGRKVEMLGIAAFLASVGGWILLVLFPVGFVQVGLFVIAAFLAGISMKKISEQPGRYLLKTVSFVALLLALVGLAVLVYAGLIYLLS